MRKKIHAITLNYRRGDLTVKCVDSLIEQVAHIWIVDNSEHPEENKDLLEKIAGLSEKSSSAKIEVVSSDRNLGFAKGIQLGIEKALGSGNPELLLIINNDAVAGKKMVDHMYRQLRTCLGAAIVTPKGISNSTPSMLWYHRIFALVLTRFSPGAFPYLSGACLLVPTSLVKPFLFDPDFFMYGEDVELSWRMAQAGVTLLTTDAYFEHGGSESSRLGSPFYEYQVIRGHILLSKKLAKGQADRILLWIGRLISLPLRASLRSIRYRSLTPWIALVCAVVGKTPPKPET